MIRRIVEGEISWYADLGLADFPNPLNSHIRLHVRESQIGIEAQGVVGAVPLRNGDTLQILPKVGRVNFLRLLFYAEGRQPELSREYENFVEYGLDDEANVDRLVARSLFAGVAEIARRSPRATRIKRRKLGVFAGGAIAVADTALRLECREREPVVYLASERSTNTAENRVLQEALSRAWLLLSEDERARFRGVLERWQRLVGRVDDLQADLFLVERGFAEGYYGGARDYYRKPLMLAQVILGSYGLGLGESTFVEGDSVLLNSADIFERYVRNVISEAYADAGYVVSKGSAGAQSLYTDGSYELRPDVVIARDGRVLLIADAKYKDAATASDHYQMNTYLLANKLNRGLILSSGFGDSQVRMREFATDQAVVVREASLPMDNLEATEAFLRKVLDLAA